MLTHSFTYGHAWCSLEAAALLPPCPAGPRSPQEPKSGRSGAPPAPSAHNSEPRVGGEGLTTQSLQSPHLSHRDSSTSSRSHLHSADKAAPQPPDLSPPLSHKPLFKTHLTASLPWASLPDHGQPGSPLASSCLPLVLVPPPQEQLSGPGGSHSLLHQELCKKKASSSRVYCLPGVTLEGGPCLYLLLHDRSQ